MTRLTDFDLDRDGKIDLRQIYDEPDPRGYYQTLSNLDYRIPAAAEPVFRQTISQLRRIRRCSRTTVLDVGSSYGVNAAILKHRYSLPGLFDIYGRDATEGQSRRELVVRDQTLFGNGRSDDTMVAIGLDRSAKAIQYANEAGIIDDGIVANLEERAPTPAEARNIAPVDLVLSTGAVGYVGSSTFAHILKVTRRSPWFALFALRMFPIDRIAATLKKCRYRVFRLEGETFRQRRFANRQERNEVLARLAVLGIDPSGRESEGWLHAEFFLACPAPEADGLRIAGLRTI